MAYYIVGLGNPGKEYEKTRHNAGKMVVHELIRNESFDEPVFKKGAQANLIEGVIEKEKVIVALPEVFMNHSGKTVSALVKSKKGAEKLLIIRDDLDLPLGTIKMTFGRGSGGHKGVESIMRSIKTKDFAQLKIGISGAGARGNVKKPHGEEKVLKFVIGKFSPKEEIVLKKTVKRAALCAARFVSHGIEVAMQETNTK